MQRFSAARRERAREHAPAGLIPDCPFPRLFLVPWLSFSAFAAINNAHHPFVAFFTCLHHCFLCAGSICHEAAECDQDDSSLR